MMQNSEILVGEANCLSLICTGRATALEDCPVIAERELAANTIGQSQIVEEKTRVGRRTPMLVTTLAETIKWLSHVGSGKIGDSRLEARPNIPHDFRIRSIGL